MPHVYVLNFLFPAGVVLTITEYGHVHRQENVKFGTDQTLYV